MVFSVAEILLGADAQASSTTENRANFTRARFAWNSMLFFCTPVDIPFVNDRCGKKIFDLSVWSSSLLIG